MVGSGFCRLDFGACYELIMQRFGSGAEELWKDCGRAAEDEREGFGFNLCVAPLYHVVSLFRKRTKTED